MRSWWMVTALVACGEPEPEPQVELDPATFNVRMTNVAAAGSASSSAGPLDPTFAPGVLVVHDGSFALFAEGAPIAFAGLEALVEDGNNAPLLAEIEVLDGVFAARSFAALDEDYNSAPMGPGDDALLTIEDVPPGSRISVAAMYGHSNDTFVATPGDGLPLFDDAGALYGELAGELWFWDGGTEVNEEPGAGANQPMSQAAPDTGPDEGGVVTVIDGVDAGGWSYPAPDAWVSVEAYGPVDGQE